VGQRIEVGGDRAVAALETEVKESWDVRKRRSRWVGSSNSRDTQGEGRDKAGCQWRTMTAVAMGSCAESRSMARAVEAGSGVGVGVVGFGGVPDLGFGALGERSGNELS
jgi:hypothetical protein